MPNPDAPTFDAHERYEYHSRDKNIHAEERPDASGEEFADEQREIQPVLNRPGNEFSVGNDEAQEAESEIKRFGLHPGILAELQQRSCSLGSIRPGCARSAQ